MVDTSSDKAKVKSRIQAIKRALVILLIVILVVVVGLFVTTLFSPAGTAFSQGLGSALPMMAM
jgi:hypothetical protein